MRKLFDGYFNQPWQDDEFASWLDAYKDIGLTNFATDENCRPSSELGAILNMYFLHDLGQDVVFHFGGVHHQIEHCWIETLENSYHVAAPSVLPPDIFVIQIPATLDKDAIPALFYSNEEALTEDKRVVLVQKSKSAGQYKDQSRGKNRFERKRYSKIANTVKQYNSIDMNNFFKKDILQVNIPVIGESDTYTVSIKMEGVVAELQKNVKNNNNKFEFRTVIQAVTKVFNGANIYVKCTCDDYKYRFSHWNIINNCSVDDSAHDPGPGKGIANPHDDKGRGCKHILLCLANGDWLMKVASVINNYVNYAAEKLQKPFLKVIFPKIYGVDAEEAVEEGIIESEDDLKSTAGLIDKINKWARTRGLRQNKGKAAPEPNDDEDDDETDKTKN